MRPGRAVGVSGGGHWFAFLGRLREDVASHGSGGFTLVELLIAVTVLPLVVGAISVGLISVFSLHAGATNELMNSGDAQMVSATFLKDVQSTELVTTAPSSVPQCGSGHQLLGLEWDGGQTSVSYVSVAVPDGAATTYQLVRYYCTFGDVTSPSMSSVVSYGLAASQGPPSVICVSSAASCPASSQWIPASEVLIVSFSITEPASHFSYTLAAAPRLGGSSGGLAQGGMPYAPFTLLDPSSCNVLRVGQGSLSLNVGGGVGNGILGVQSTCPDSVSVSNGGTLAASSVVTSDQGLNSIAPNDKATYPATEYYQGQFSDPFSVVSPPSNPTSAQAASCSSTQITGANGNQSVNYSCPSGIYASAPVFDQTSTSTISFTGTGTHWFQEGLSIPNNVTVSFAPGVYMFSGSTALSIGNNVSASGADVLWYVESGAVSVGENVSVSLAASSGYDDIAFWDGAAGETIQVGDNSDVNFNGGIFMPQGSLSAGANVTFQATFIVADSAIFGNNLDLTIFSP